MTPGDNALIEVLCAEPGQVIQLLVAEQPTLKVHWTAIAESAAVEYADPATGRLQQRLVVLRQAQPAG